jgi:hypothetical protein
VSRRGVLVVALALAGSAAFIHFATPVSAQTLPTRDVDISFDVGSFDPGLDDWAIDAVEVEGDLAAGAPFTVELRGSDDTLLWSATQPYPGQPTRITVSSAVAVGDVAQAGISQPDVAVAGVQIERPEVTWSAAGGGGSGQLALSMVLAIIVVAVVFRTPLPSASSQRWTR